MKLATVISERTAQSSAPLSAHPSSPSRRQSDSYRPDVDGLRAIAVLLVVGYHADMRLIPGGFIGVDVFFVISGYLITRIILREALANDFSFARFYGRRARRILPALFFVLVSAGIAAYSILSPAELRAFGRDLIGNMLFVPNVVYWRYSGYFDIGAAQLPLLHTWSLGVEEQFYAVFPLFLIWALKHDRPFAARYIAGALIFSLLACMTLAYVRSPQGAFYGAPFRAWQLLAGSMITLVELSDRTRGRSHPARSALGLVLILVCAFRLTSTAKYPTLIAIIPTLGAALLLLGRDSTDAANRVLAMSPLVEIGLVSYSFYLWHWPFLVFARYLNPELSAIGTIAVVALALLAAVLSWRFIEHPFRMPGRLSSTSARRAALAVGCGLFAFGAAAQFSNGIPSRYPAPARRFLAVQAEQIPLRDRCPNLGIAGAGDGVLCQIGDSSSAAQFLVWGDSHAGALLPAFRDLAARYDVAGLVAMRPACPTASGVWRLDRRPNDCSAFNEAVLDLVRTKGIRTVFLVGFWSMYGMPLQSSWGFDVVHPYLYRDSIAVPTSPTESRAMLARRLEGTVAQLRGLDARVVLVEDVPNYRTDPVLALARSARFGRSTATIGVAADSFLVNRLSLARLLPAATLADSAITIVDPARALCAESRCAVARDGQSLYMDRNHLSRLGARVVEPVFESLFAKRIF